MKYVYLEDNIVVDRLQTNPYIIFGQSYASQFIEAPDEVDLGWKLQDDKWIAPSKPTPEEIKIENKTKATALLSESDWSQNPDVIDTTLTPHLTNVEEWKTYRLTLRNIVVNPPETLVTNWPVKPNSIWNV